MSWEKRMQMTKSGLWEIDWNWFFAGAREAELHLCEQFKAGRVSAVTLSDAAPRRRVHAAWTFFSAFHLATDTSFRLFEPDLVWWIGNGMKHIEILFQSPTSVCYVEMLCDSQTQGGRKRICGFKKISHRKIWEGPHAFHCSPSVLWYPPKKKLLPSNAFMRHGKRTSMSKWISV